MNEGLRLWWHGRRLRSRSANARKVASAKLAAMNSPAAANLLVGVFEPIGPETLEEVRLRVEDAHEALLTCGAVAIPPLAAHLRRVEEADAPEPHLAIEVLVHIGGAEAARTLAPFLGKWKSVRRGLASLGAAALAPLREIVEGNGAGLLYALSLLEALARSEDEPSSAAALSALGEAASLPDGKARFEAGRALLSLGDERGVPSLVEHLKSGEYRRRNALELLQEADWEPQTGRERALMELAAGHTSALLTIEGGEEARAVLFEERLEDLSYACKCPRPRGDAEDKVFALWRLVDSGTMDKESLRAVLSLPAEVATFRVEEEGWSESMDGWMNTCEVPDVPVSLDTLIASARRQLVSGDDDEKA